MVLDISKLVLMFGELAISTPKKRIKKKGFVQCTSYLFDKSLIDMLIIGMIYFFGVYCCSHQIQVL